MEWALHIASADEVRAELNPLEIDRFEPGPKLRPLVALAVKLIEEYFGRIEFTRYVYGNEFCERLIPTRARLEAALSAAHDQGARFSLLTPYVSDSGIDALRSLLDSLSCNSEQAEVVFNDWGVLNLLNRDYPNLVPVQGRLMIKSLRDPRITGVYGASATPATALVSLRRSNLDCSSYTGFLSGLGVGVAELDNLPQGVDFGFVEGEVKASVYLPFGFISTSRICMAAGAGYRKGDKFQPGAPCHHECQTHLLEYVYTNSPFENRDQRFYLRGNTYFYAHTEAMLRSLFEQARAGLISRFVFQPRLPMTWDA